MLAIYKKEVKGYLTSMIGYVFIAFVLVVVGIYFTAYNITSSYPEFGVTLQSVTFIFLIITPILTMRVLAEEKRQKTDQLLFTSPVSIWKVVLGKYLALVSIYLIPIVIISIYPLIMGKYGTVSYAMAYLSIFGFFLLGCANIAVGLFVSALTESQVIAAVLTFAALFICYMISGIQSFFSTTADASFTAIAVLAIILCMIIYHMTQDFLITGVVGVMALGGVIITYAVKSSLFEGAIQKVLNIFNITSHFESFIGGIFDLTGVIYLLSIVFIFIFLTIQTIQKRRWR